MGGHMRGNLYPLFNPDQETAPPRPVAGEERESLTYGSYLRLPDLLDSQRPLADPPAHDELMFIITHQVYELWFRLLLHELTAARDAMLAADAHRARLILERCQTVERLMINQVDLLDTLSPVAFLEFRPALDRASGVQSAQFREIEFLSGWKDERYLHRLRGCSAVELRRLRDRLAEPSLWEAFLRVLAQAGLAVDEPEQRRAALLAVACGGTEYRELWRLAEGLLDHDQSWSLWLGRHALLAERQLGGRMGTGETTGVEYLRSRERRHFYPELWDVRGLL
jgi:tryptophan 2,3-dioxygenase